MKEMEIPRKRIQEIRQQVYEKISTDKFIQEMEEFNKLIYRI